MENHGHLLSIPHDNKSKQYLGPTLHMGLGIYVIIGLLHAPRRLGGVRTS